MSKFGTMANWNNLSPEDQLSLHLSLDRLAQDNPGIVKQLQRLADLKENEPKKWEAGLKILKIA